MNHYETLGVATDATPDEIKSAWRKKAKEHHPDRNQNDPTAESAMKAINEAYDVLKSTNARTSYDTTGGNHGGIRTQPMTNVLRGNVGVPLKTMLFGGELKIPVQVPVQHIDSMGHVLGFGMRTEVVSIIVEPHTPVGTNIILSSVDHGIDGITQIRFGLYPEPSKDDSYQIDGADIYVQTKTDPFAIMFADEITMVLPTTETVKITLPATASKAAIRLGGKGLYSTNGQRGNVYVIVDLQMPTLSDTQVGEIKKILRPDRA